MLMDSAKLASFGAFFHFARPAQLIGVFLHAVWTVERCIHSCIAGCHARGIEPLVDVLDRNLRAVLRYY